MTVPLLAFVAFVVLLLMGCATFSFLNGQLDRFGGLIAGGVVGLMVLYAVLGLVVASGFGGGELPGG